MDGLQVYLSGEIHTAWREEIIRGAAAEDLDIDFTGPVTNHEASDAAGDMLGAEDKAFWRDHKSAKVNSIRTKTLIEASDLVIVRFGDQFKQWNAAFDAGFAVALGRPLISLHPPELDHALKEVDAAAQATARDPGQVVEVLRYVIMQK